MGQCFVICCPPPDDDIGNIDENSPLLGRSNHLNRAVPVDIDENYPRDDEPSKLDKIVRNTAGAFVDINSGDMSITTSRDKETMYQSTLTSLPPQNTAVLLPDNGIGDPEEVFSKTTITKEDLEKIAADAEKANTALDFKIETDEKLVEAFDNTPKY